MRTRLTALDKAGRWRSHIEGWRQSELSQRKYCEASGLALSTFQWWRQRLLSQTSVTSTALELVAVPVRSVVSQPEPTRLAGTPIVLVLASSRYRIELQEGFSGRTLEEALSILEVR